MAFKGIIAAAASVALITTPTLASAQATKSAVASATNAREVAPASETVQGEQLRGGFIIPLIALIAIILGLCAATDVCGGDDNDLPHSP
ncbi:MAG: hypothetical protein QOJ91_730 [Sphingomonadales bacterium]|nr:hypothetical protein [Sphingomonadales bacterium]